MCDAATLVDAFNLELFNTKNECQVKRREWLGDQPEERKKTSLLCVEWMLNSWDHLNKFYRTHSKLTCNEQGKIVMSCQHSLNDSNGAKFEN